ncbi:MAG: hypothetical protein HZB76_07010, partial [Chlamydiae bacterium]|nr:hypothetical protein [Chlamydiota bacterium]
MPTGPTDPSGLAGPEKIGKDKGLESDKSGKPDSGSFQSYLKEAPGKPATPSEISQMELASKSAISTTPSFQSLLGQVSNAQDSLGEIEKNIKTPQLAFKRSQEKLLNSKLNDANDHLKSAVEKLGGNVPSPTDVDKKGGPLAKFVGLLTDGQNKLLAAQNQISAMSKQGKSLSAPDMLLVQVKLSQAQQEIEYSSILLSKVVDT